MTESYIKTLNISSKLFLELAKTERDSKKRKAFVLSAMINSWVLLEAYTNYLSEILSKAKIESHEKALLHDKELKLNELGQFVEIRSHSPTLKRALFVLQKFSTSFQIEEFRTSELWRNIQQCERTRNDLIHPKTITKDYLEHQITIKKAEKFREDIVLFIKYTGKKTLGKEILLD